MSDATLAIDPGVDLCGWSWSVASSIRAVGHSPPDFFAGIVGPVRVMIESPVIYPHGNSEGTRDPEVIMRLRETVGYISGLLAAHGITAATTDPRAWKGQLKKPVHHSRVWALLTERERRLIADACGHTPEFMTNKIERACETLARTRAVTGYSWNAHNVLDAAGLNIWMHGHHKHRPFAELES